MGRLTRPAWVTQASQSGHSFVQADPEAQSTPSSNTGGSRWQPQQPAATQVMGAGVTAIQPSGSSASDGEAQLQAAHSNAGGGAGAGRQPASLLDAPAASPGQRSSATPGAAAAGSPASAPEAAAEGGQLGEGLSQAAAAEAHSTAIAAAAAEGCAPLPMGAVPPKQQPQVAQPVLGREADGAVSATVGDAGALTLQHAPCCSSRPAALAARASTWHTAQHSPHASRQGLGVLAGSQHAVHVQLESCSCLPPTSC